MERRVDGGLVPVEAAPAGFFTAAPFVGVGDVRGFASTAVAATGLLVAALARKGARPAAVEPVVVVRAGAPVAVGRVAAPVPGAAPLVGAVGALLVGAVDVLEANVEALGAVVVFGADVAAPVAVEAPRGRLAVVGAVLGAVEAEGATDGRALPGVFLSAVEVGRKGARVVGGTGLPVVRGLASAVTLALGLRGAAAGVGLVSASVEGEGMGGSTGDPSSIAPAATA